MSLMARQTRADLEADAGRLRSARTEYLGIARRRRELALASDDLFAALLFDNLANVESRLGMLEEAESHLAEALRIWARAPERPRHRYRDLLPASIPPAGLFRATGPRRRRIPRVRGRGPKGRGAADLSRAGRGAARSGRAGDRGILRSLSPGNAYLVSTERSSGIPFQERV